MAMTYTCISSVDSVDRMHSQVVQYAHGLVLYEQSHNIR